MELDKVKNGFDEYARSDIGRQILSPTAAADLDRTDIAWSAFMAGASHAMKAMKAGAKKQVEAKLDKYYDAGVE